MWDSLADSIPQTKTVNFIIKNSYASVKISLYDCSQAAQKTFIVSFVSEN